VEKFWDFYRDGITQSLYRSFLHCRSQCYLQYVEGWSSDHEPIWFTYGKAFHYIMEQAYKGYKPPHIDEIYEWLANYRGKIAANRDRPIPMKKLEELELIYKLVETVAPIYFAYYAKDFGNDYNTIATEQIFKIPYNQTYLNGCLDHIYEFLPEDTLNFRDHKFLSVIDEDGITDTLYLDPQVNIYCIALEYLFGRIPKTFYLNIIRRPRDLPKKGQSVEQYCQKIKKDIISDFPHWFKRIPYTILLEEHYAWRRNILVPVINDIERWVQEGYPRYINTEALVSRYGKCSMFQLLTSDNDVGFYKRKHVFQELQELA
jgi:hypothetical protein